MGSPHQRVYSYAFRPPASAEAVVRIEAILETKLTGVKEFQSVPRSMERLRAVLAAWATESATEGVVAAVRGASAGFLAAVQSGTRIVLICSLDGIIREDPESLLRAAELASGEPAPIDAALLDECIAAVAGHVDAALALEGLPETATATRSVRSILLRRISHIVRSARPHDKACIADLATAARRAVTRPSGAFAERQLEDASRLSMPDDVWLMALASRNDPNERAEAHRRWKIVSVVMFTAQGQANALSGATER